MGDKPPRRKRRPRHQVVHRRKNLASLIESLPAVDVQREDIKTLALQLILDTPNDNPKGDYAVRAKVKLETLKLLADLAKDEDSTDNTKELLEILRGD